MARDGKFVRKPARSYIRSELVPVQSSAPAQAGTMEDFNVVTSLRAAMFISALLDVGAGASFFVAPGFARDFLGVEADDLVVRFIASGLLGIGVASTLSVLQFRNRWMFTFLTLKAVWQLFTVVAIVIFAVQESSTTRAVSPGVWVVLTIAGAGTLVWIFFSFGLWNSLAGKRRVKFHL